jgi:hypothetical protein
VCVFVGFLKGERERETGGEGEEKRRKGKEKRRKGKERRWGEY